MSPCIRSFSTLVKVSWASRFSVWKSGIMFPVRQFNDLILFKFLICQLCVVDGFQTQMAGHSFCSYRLRTLSICIRAWMLVLVVMSPLPAWEIMKPILDAVFTRCAVWERRNSLGLGFKDKQLMIGRFSNFTSSYTVVLLSIICTQLGFRADHLGYLRVPSHALGSVEFDGMSSAGLTSTACWRGT